MNLFDGMTPGQILALGEKRLGSYCGRLAPTCTFRLQIQESDRTILDTAITTKASREELIKAKKNVRRLLDEYAPLPPVLAPAPAPDIPATPEPEARRLPAPQEQVTDGELEKLWRELADVPFDDNDPDLDMTLAEDWQWFRKGTPREEIWHWFDERHSKGVAFLLYGPDGPEPQEAPEEAPPLLGGGHFG